MSALLTLLLTYLLVLGDASPATRPLRFVQDLRQDTLRAAAYREPFIFRRSRALAFPASVPEPPAPVPVSAAVGRTLMNTRRIVFPGGGTPAPGDGYENRTSSGVRGTGDSGAITPSRNTTAGGVRFPAGLNRNATPLEHTSSCVVGYNLTVSYKGAQWKLLSRGKCPLGEWVVMVAECQPGCRPQPCPKGELEYQGRCVKLSDPTVCGEGQTLYLAQTGSTFCDCEQDHFYYPWRGICYARRERGPCDFGFVLDINQSGNVECMPNECQMGGFEKDPTSGKCYRKDFVGYCPLTELEFHADNQTVGCLLVNTRNIFERSITPSCTAGSRLDHAGNCRQELVVPSTSILPRSLTHGCRTGFISVGNGPCRRVNSSLS